MHQGDIDTSNHGVQVPIVPLVIHEYLGEDGFFNTSQLRFDNNGKMAVTALDPIDTKGYASKCHQCSIV